MTYALGGTTLGNLTYAYDFVGRRTNTGGSFGRTVLPLPVSQTAYNADNQLLQWGTANIFYDANGNTTSSGTDGYTWDARNRLVSTLSGAAFQYDAFGRRSSKTTGGTATNFLYDGVNAVQELSGTTPTANLLSGGVDELFQRTDSSGMRSFLIDALGSTMELTDSMGALQTQYTFDPFGNTSSTGTASTNGLAYTGRELDATGLYFYRARYYNPQLQRFMSEDPLGFGGGDTNLYSYVSDSPTNLVDPLGLYSNSGPGIAVGSSGMGRGKGGNGGSPALPKCSSLGAIGLLAAGISDASQWTGGGYTIGLNGNALKAVGVGVDAQGSVALVSDPNGNVGVAKSLAVTPSIGARSYGGGIIIGGSTYSDLSGYSSYSKVDYTGTVGDGFATGFTKTSNSSGITLTAYVGFGKGGSIGGQGLSFTNNVQPFCKQ